MLLRPVRSVCQTIAVDGLDDARRDLTRQAHRPERARVHEGQASRRDRQLLREADHRGLAMRGDEERGHRTALREPLKIRVGGYAFDFIGPFDMRAAATVASA